MIVGYKEEAWTWVPFSEILSTYYFFLKVCGYMISGVITRSVSKSSFWNDVMMQQVTCPLHHHHLTQGSWFKSQLFCFQSSFLVMHVEKHWKTSQVLGLHLPRRGGSGWISWLLTPAWPSLGCWGHSLLSLFISYINNWINIKEK